MAAALRKCSLNEQSSFDASHHSELEKEMPCHLDSRRLGSASRSSRFRSSRQLCCIQSCCLDKCVVRLWVCCEPFHNGNHVNPGVAFNFGFIV
jgi:hypothetical protein